MRLLLHSTTQKSKDFCQLRSDTNECNALAVIVHMYVLEEIQDNCLRQVLKGFDLSDLLPSSRGQYSQR